MATRKFKACPHCGCLRTDGGPCDLDSDYYRECSDCHASVVAGSQKQADEKWNKRSRPKTK